MNNAGLMYLVFSLTHFFSFRVNSENLVHLTLLFLFLTFPGSILKLNYKLNYVNQPQYEVIIYVDISHSRKKV